MKNRIFAVIIGAVIVTPTVAQEKDVFNYVAQKNAGKDVKKIVFIADPDTHGAKGNHEFKAGAVYMARFRVSQRLKEKVLEVSKHWEI